MDATNNIAVDLFYKVRSRFTGLKLGESTGAITINPEQARFFDFNYMAGETAIGHVSISLAEPRSMKVYFTTGITEAMDTSQKTQWYGFLKELRQFAKRRLLSFDTRDIAKDNLDKRDFEFLSQNSNPKPPVGESLMSESAMYGSRLMSYQKLMDTRLIIKHDQAVMDDAHPGARTRHINALFVENQDGERFKYPFIHLAGARAMQRHVANQGVPYDDVGKSIVKMSEEIAQLKSFGNYVVRNDLMNSETNSVIERSTNYLNSLREQIKAISKQRHYENYRANFQADAALEIPQEVVEDFKQKFTVRSFKEDIATVFPVLYRLMKEGDMIGYDDIVEMTQEELANEDLEVDTEYYDPMSQFENWVMALGEESAVTSEDPEQQTAAIQKLQELIGQAFPAGVDGTNAIESLKGIIEDPELFKRIKAAATENADADVRSQIQGWLELNAPETLEQLDFGDMAEAPAEEPAAAPEADAEMPAVPAQEPQIAADDPDERNKDDSDDLPFDPDENPTDKDEFGNTIKNKARHLARKGMRQAMDVKEVAEFISSFYDRDSGTFPKGPEGVVVMVGKKFGEQAEQVARKFVERMAPHQEQGAEQMQELARIRELAGMTDTDVAEGPLSGTYYYEKLARKVFDENPNLDTSGRAREVMDAGFKIAVADLGKKQAQGLFGYDEDFPSDFVSAYSELKRGSNEESVSPELENSVSESQDDIYTINNPDMERDAETGREEPDEIEVKVEFSSYDDEFEIDKVIRLDTKEDITDKVSNDRDLYFSLAHDVQQREQGRERDYNESIQDDANSELDRIRKLSGISQGLGL